MLLVVEKETRGGLCHSIVISLRLGCIFVCLGNVTNAARRLDLSYFLI